MCNSSVQLKGPGGSKELEGRVNWWFGSDMPAFVWVQSQEHPLWLKNACENYSFWTSE